MMNIILLQAFYYSVVMGLSIGMIGFMQKGFFYKYCKVRFSFGRLLMVKVRSPIRDYFEIGRIEEGYLIYGPKKRELRSCIKKNYNAVYRCLSVNWIDLDEESRGISSIDYQPLEGYDAKKFSDLLVRALTKPVLGDNKEKMFMLALAGCIILSGAAAYLALKNQDLLMQLKNGIPGMIKTAFEGMKGTVVSGGGL